MLEDLFTYADIEGIHLADNDKVYIEATIRKTGASIFVEGDDLDDATDVALRNVEDQMFLVDNIMRDYGLTLNELRTLVDLSPVSSQYDEPPQQLGDLPTNLTDIAILASPLDLIAAQPFLAIDSQNNDLFLALRLPRPDELGLAQNDPNPAVRDYDEYSAYDDYDFC